MAFQANTFQNNAFQIKAAAASLKIWRTAGLGSGFDGGAFYSGAFQINENGYTDYSQWVYAGNEVDAIVSLIHNLNQPRELDFILQDGVAGFVLPDTGNRVQFNTAAWGVTFTGYITSISDRELLCASDGTSTEAVYGYHVKAVSEDLRLEWQAPTVFPTLAPFLSQYQGQIVKALIAALGANFDVTNIANGTFVPYFRTKPDEGFWDAVRRLSDHGNMAFWVNNGIAYYQHYTSAVFPYSANDADAPAKFDPTALTTTQIETQLYNDVVGVGNIEAQDYVHEYFVGDGLTATFPLKLTMYGAESAILLEDDWTETNFDGNTWLLHDTDGLLRLAGGTLQLLGGTGLTQSWLTALQGIELAGKVEIACGRALFNTPTNGIIGGLYLADSGALADCVCGFRATPNVNGVLTDLQPIVNGVAVGPIFTALNTRTYLLTIWADTQYQNRQDQTFFSSALGDAFGGVTRTTTLNLSFQISELPDNTVDLPTVVLQYSSSISNAPVWAFFSPVSGPFGNTSTAVNCTLNFTIIRKPFQAALWSNMFWMRGVDEFQRASIGANWTGVENGGIAIYNSSEVYNSSTVAGTRQTSYYNQIAPPNDQFAELMISTTLNPGTDANGIGPAVRISSSTDSYYAYYITGESRYLIKSVGGTVSVLASITGVGDGAAVGNILRLEVRGTLLTSYLNGIVDLTAQDTDLTAGYVGIASVSDGSNDLRGQNWAGGGLVLSANATAGAWTRWKLGDKTDPEARAAIVPANEITNIQFFTGQTPAPGEIIRVVYRSAGVARVRIQDNNSITTEANKSGDSGIRAAILQQLNPEPQNSIELEAAIQAFMADHANPAYEGKWKFNTALYGVGNPTANALGSEIFSGSSLSSSWTATEGGFSVLNNQVYVSAVGGDSRASAYWNAATFGANQFSQIRITAVGSTGSELGPAVRMSSSAETYYALLVVAGNAYIQKVVAGVLTTLTAPYAHTLADNDLLRLEISGNNLTGYLNGIPILTATDSAIAFGSAGIVGFSATSPHYGKNWIGGNMNASPLVPAPGLFLTTNCLSRFPAYTSLVNQVQIDFILQDFDGNEYMDVTATFGPLYRLEEIQKQFAPADNALTGPMDSIVPLQPQFLYQVGAFYANDRPAGDFDGTRTPSTFELDMGSAPDGSYEVRKTDYAWGSGSAINLISTPTGQKFTIPRASNDVVAFIRNVIANSQTDALTAAMSASWLFNSASFAIDPATHSLKTATVYLTQAGMYWGGGVAFTQNQYAEVTLAAIDDLNGAMGPAVLMDPAQVNYYGFYIHNATAYLFKMDGASQVVISTVAATAHVGDVLRLEINGTTLTAKQNGNIVLTATDSTFSTGAPGIQGFQLCNARVTNFQGGNLLSSGTGYALEVFDPFVRANQNPLNSSWQAVPGEQPAQIVSDAVEPTNANKYARMFFKGALIDGSAAFSADQYAEWFPLSIAATSYVGVAVRCSSTSDTFYEWVVTGPLGSPTTSILRKCVAGVVTNIATFSVTVPNGDRIMRLEVQGATLTCRLNGIVVQTATDTSIASGSPGFVIFDSANVANVTAVDFKAGNIVSSNGNNFQGLSRFPTVVRIAFPMIPNTPTATLDNSDPLHPIVTIGVALISDPFAYTILITDGSGNTLYKTSQLAWIQSDLQFTYDNSVSPSRNLTFKVSALNLLGEQSGINTITDTIPTPTILTLTIDESTGTLKWTATNATQYLVEIATDSGYTNIILSKTTTDQFFRLDDENTLRPRYFRVTPQDAIGSGAAATYGHSHTPSGVIDARDGGAVDATDNVYSVDFPAAPGNPITPPTPFQPWTNELNGVSVLQSRKNRLM